MTNQNYTFRVTQRQRIIFTAAIASVWLINGLYCKILGQVPRHEAIVSRILGSSHPGILTIIIGVLEILMVIWILSRIQYKFCTLFQIVIVLSMNVLEFLLAPDLLLFGRFNILWAVLFSAAVYWNAYHLDESKKSVLA